MTYVASISQSHLLQWIVGNIVFKDQLFWNSFVDLFKWFLKTGEIDDTKVKSFWNILNIK